MTDACKSCHETSAPTRRKGNIISSTQKAYGNIALRFAAIALFALGLLSPVNVTRAESEVRCPESGMPIETLGSEKEQRQVLYQQAKACVNGGKPLQAVALLSRVIKSDPTDAVAYLNRGSAQAAAGEVALALSDFSLAINLDPNLVEAWYNRGTTFTHIRRFESAIADFTEAIRLKPDLALAYCNRGLANVQLGRYDEALVDYVVAIDRDPKLTYCYFNRGSHPWRLSEGDQRPHRSAQGKRRRSCRLDAARPGLRSPRPKERSARRFPRRARRQSEARKRARRLRPHRDRAAEV
jgi:tetratricopeptide (TPR) repeat protein